MRQILALLMSVLTLAPSLAFAAEETVSNPRLILSGKATEAAITELIRLPSHNSRQSSQQSPPNDEKWLGMHPAVTISLFTAGIGATLGALAAGQKEDETHPPTTAGERAKGALVGAGIFTGIFWLAALAHSR